MKYLEMDFYFIPSSKDKMSEIQEEFEVADTRYNGQPIIFFYKRICWCNSTRPKETD